MATTAPILEETRLAPGELAQIWVRHLSSFLIPLSSLAFLWTGPHVWYVAPLFMLPVIFALSVDTNATVETRQPLESTPAWPFDAIVYALTALQLICIYQLAVMFSQQGFFSVDMVMVIVVVGGNSGFSIITAHELIHRKNPREQWLGRLLLATVLQEHFFTEHLRGHHPRVGKEEDPATARFGESYEGFYRRTVPGQIRSAWELERRRLGDPQMSLFDRRMLRNRLLHGALIGWGLAFTILFTFGVVPFVAFLLQAFMASRLLEAVNYFEHWGLRRHTRNVRPVDSWDTHSWFTYYGLTGLSRHADHHQAQARPYQQLRIFEEAPILPTGYVGMTDMVIGRNDEYQQHAVRELRRRELGPFAPDASPEERADAEEKAAEILQRELPPPTGFFGRTPKSARGWLRRISILTAIAFVTALGVTFETGSDVSLLTRTALHGWILMVFWAATRVRLAHSLRGGNEGVAWSMAMGLLVVLGSVTTAVTGLP